MASDLLQAAPGAAIEGRLGSVVTLRAAPADAESLARLTGVTGVRLPSLAWRNLHRRAPMHPAAKR